jgi:predicted DsbA family dithiol-disulfide isomerase
VRHHQPRDRRRLGDPEQLKRTATVSGVDKPQKVYDAAAGDAYEAELQETMDAVEELSVDDVPRITVDGETYSPNHESEEMYAAVDASDD